MSAREAYIAGRSGGSRPRDVSTGSPGSSSQRQQEQNAYDAGRQERQRAQTIKEEGIAGLSQREREQAKKIAQNVAKQGQFKDPYDTLTEKEKIKAGYPEEKKDEKIDIKKVIKYIPSLTAKGVIGGAAAIQALLDKVFKPELSDFSNPNFLAVMNAAFKSGEVNKDRYLEDYGELINEAYGSDSEDFLEAQGFNVSGEDLFNQKLAATESDAFFENLNPSVQFNVDPSRYMKGEDYFMPQTMGDLEGLASLNAQKYLSGPNYDPKLAQMIFDAREQVSRQRDAQERRDGGAGIPSLYGGTIQPIPLPDPSDPTPDPDLPVPRPPGEPPFQGPGMPIMQPIIEPIMQPTPFDYSQLGPHFGPQYPGHYANQGIPGQAWPQFNYWNQIANTFPGMRS